jgi:hypothetical protein
LCRRDAINIACLPSKNIIRSANVAFLLPRSNKVVEMVTVRAWKQAMVAEGTTAWKREYWVEPDWL